MLPEVLHETFIAACRVNPGVYPVERGIPDWHLVDEGPFPELPDAGACQEHPYGVPDVVLGAAEEPVE